MPTVTPPAQLLNTDLVEKMSMLMAQSPCVMDTSTYLYRVASQLHRNRAPNSLYEHLVDIYEIAEQRQVDRCLQMYEEFVHTNRHSSREMRRFRRSLWWFADDLDTIPDFANIEEEYVLLLFSAVSAADEDMQDLCEDYWRTLGQVATNPHRPEAIDFFAEIDKRISWLVVD